MSSVLMVGGGVQQRHAVELVRSLGYRVVVSDRNPDAPCAPLADVFWQADGRDVEGLVARVLRHGDALDIRAVFTLTELVTTVAAVCHAAGIPGAPLRAAVACQYKPLAKESWLRAGVPTPAGESVATPEDARKAVERLGGKAFVKPAVGFGGRGCTPVTDPGDAPAAFRVAAASSNGGEVLVEALAEGSMHDANGAFDRHGRFHGLGIADRWFHDRLPVELGARCPTTLSPARQAELLDLLERGARALGIERGPVKADAVLTEDGWRLLELAPRLHGPKGTLWLMPPVLGYQPLEAALVALLGGDPGAVTGRAAPRARHCAFRALEAAPGRVSAITGVDAARQLPGVENVMVFAREGDLLGGGRNATPVTAGYVCASGPDPATTERVIGQAVETIRIETEDSP